MLSIGHSRRLKQPNSPDITWYHNYYNCNNDKWFRMLVNICVLIFQMDQAIAALNKMSDDEDDDLIMNEQDEGEYDYFQIYIQH